MSNYNYKNWKEGDRVRANPDFEGWSDANPSYFTMKGTVKGVSKDTMKVIWDDGLDVYYSKADKSLINLTKERKKWTIPENLFDI